MFNLPPRLRNILRRMNLFHHYIHLSQFQSTHLHRRYLPRDAAVDLKIVHSLGLRCVHNWNIVQTHTCVMDAMSALMLVNDLHRQNTIHAYLALQLHLYQNLAYMLHISICHLEMFYPINACAQAAMDAGDRYE